MRKLFEEYGSVIVVVIAIVALITLVITLMQPSGPMGKAFEDIIQSFVDKTNDAGGGEGGAGGPGGSDSPGNAGDEEGWPIRWNMAEITSNPAMGSAYKVSDLTPDLNRLSQATVSCPSFVAGYVSGAESDAIINVIYGDAEEQYLLEIDVVTEPYNGLEPGVYVADYSGNLIGQDIDFVLDDATPVAHTDSITDSWDEIREHIEAGDYTTRYRLGDTKTVVLSNGTSIVMEIVAFDKDEKSDGNLAAITWMSKRTTVVNSMNPTSATTGGWEESKLRAWLQTDYYDLFPSEVRDVIVDVNKTYVDYADGSTKSCVDNIWIPSRRELYGNAGAETSGATYLDCFPDAASRAKEGYGGGTSVYWLRTACSSQAFCFILKNQWGRCNANSLIPVVVGFCT